MFDKLRRLISQKAADVREVAGLPPDLKNVPQVGNDDLGAVGLETLSGYLGRTVESIEPMGILGAEATSMLGRRVQERLRAAGADGLAPGEMVPGQAAAREARMRAEGATEEQIQMIRERIAAVTSEHTAHGWQLGFSQGHRATVQLFAMGSEGAEEFDRLEARWDRENGTDGHRPQDTAALAATVQRITDSPYESYCLSGKLLAKGATHVAVAQSGRVATPVLAGMAAVALRTVEQGTTRPPT